MNVANIITVIRIILAPFLLWALLTKNFLFASILFVSATFTDFLDGKIARANKTVTNLGKFLDPIADKILTTFSYLYLIKVGLANITPVAVILAREFMLAAVRMEALQHGVVIFANIFGKIKTFFQFFSIFLSIFYLYVSSEKSLDLCVTENLFLFSRIFLWIAAIFSIFSCITYMKQLFIAKRDFF